MEIGKIIIVATGLLLLIGLLGATFFCMQKKLIRKESVTHSSTQTITSLEADNRTVVHARG